VDAINAAAVLSAGRPASTWPLARVSEHDCRALVADLVRHSEAGEQGGEAALQRQRSVVPAGRALEPATARESCGHRAAVASQLLASRGRSETAAPGTDTAASHWHHNDGPATAIPTETAERRWLPDTGHQGLWLKAELAASQGFAEDPDLRPADGGNRQGLPASSETGVHPQPSAVAACRPGESPSGGDAWPANYLQVPYSGAVADAGVAPVTSNHSEFGVDAASGEQPPAECPGNPFAAARDQQTDNTDAFPAVASVRRRTPTPLLSTLRPDYKAGREHPLLRW